VDEHVESEDWSLRRKRLKQCGERDQDIVPLHGVVHQLIEGGALHILHQFGCCEG